MTNGTSWHINRKGVGTTLFSSTCSAPTSITCDTISGMMFFNNYITVSFLPRPLLHLSAHTSTVCSSAHATMVCSPAHTTTVCSPAHGTIVHAVLCPSFCSCFTYCARSAPPASVCSRVFHIPASPRACGFLQRFSSPTLCSSLLIISLLLVQMTVY